MIEIKQWKYEYLAKICGENQTQYISLMNAGHRDIKKSVWLRLMGLFETWDITS